MGGGDVPKCGADEEEETAEPPPLVMAGAISGVALVEAPILLLLQFHKAVREELTELRRIAVEASEKRNCEQEFVLDLHRRFEFLKLFQKYHSASEDEVCVCVYILHLFWLLIFNIFFGLCWNLTFLHL